MASTHPYPLLTAPTVIGPLALRNRMVLCPMGDDLAEPDGTVSQAQLDHYEARAAGGVGLLLVGSVSVAHPHGAHAAEQVAASQDAHVEGLAALARRAHRHGAAIGAQLVHAGPNAVLDIAEGRLMLVPATPPRLSMDALSGMVSAEEMEAMTEPFVRPGAAIAYREANEEDLAAVVARFAAAARRVAAAGFDAIEVHAGHGYLIDAFLSPRTNTRSDRWGGDVVGRSRLLVQVLEAIRAAVGPQVALWCRLNAREVGEEGGETLADAVAVARLAVAAGAQAIHASAYASPGRAIGITEAHTPHQPGARLGDAAVLRAAVDVPIITMGRLDAAAAETALAAGQADLIGFGRALLADPELPAAISAGDAGAARPCAYQYHCIGNIFLHRPLACAVRPETGVAVPTVARAEPVATPQRILVVGGGPVGMEVAHRLASAGHRVTLREGSDRLGGLLVVGGACDPALAPLLSWLRRRVSETGVDVWLRSPVGADGLVGPADDPFDQVILATGAPWARDPRLPGVITVDDLRRSADDPLALLNAGPAVVLGGGKAAVSIAGAARAQGREVTLVADGPVLAPELGLPGRFRLVHDLGESGVDTVTGVAVGSVAGGAVVLADGRELAAATVIDADPARRVAGSSLADAVGNTRPIVHLLGDATGAWGLEAGFQAAAELARSLTPTPR